MNRSRRIRARLRARHTFPREAAYIAAAYRQSLFWQMINDVADAEDAANTNESTPVDEKK